MLISGGTSVLQEDIQYSLVSFRRQERWELQWNPPPSPLPFSWYHDFNFTHLPLRCLSWGFIIHSFSCDPQFFFCISSSFILFFFSFPSPVSHLPLIDYCLPACVCVWFFLHFLCLSLSIISPNIVRVPLRAVGWRYKSCVCRIED